jgi:sigma-B regulation protein RsbQ
VRAVAVSAHLRTATVTVAQPDAERVLLRHAVRLSGDPAGRPLVLLHGFGCDSAVWRFVLPLLEDRFRVVTLDQIGAGDSDPAAYDPVRYDGLEGYADDLVQVCEALDLRDAVLVGHSVSAMTVVLAAPHLPERVTGLVLVAPTPRYLDDEVTGYRGGFTRQDIEGLLEVLDSNWLGWSESMAPVIMGEDHPEMAADLTRSFCRTDPQIAAQFAEVTFLSDNRADLEQAVMPALVLQCTRDALASESIGEYVAEHLPRGELLVLQATGHCPHMSAPAEVAEAVRRFAGT